MVAIATQNCIIDSTYSYVVIFIMYMLTSKRYRSGTLNVYVVFIFPNTKHCKFHI